MNKVNTYLTVYEMLVQALNHECSGSKKFSPDNTKDDVGIKCLECEDSFKISVRRLRNTMKDPRLAELVQEYKYMDLLKKFVV